MNPEYPANGYPGKELPLEYDPVPLPDEDRVVGPDGDEAVPQVVPELKMPLSKQNVQSSNIFQNEKYKVITFHDAIFIILMDPETTPQDCVF